MNIDLTNFDEDAVYNDNIERGEAALNRSIKRRALLLRQLSKQELINGELEKA